MNNRAYATVGELQLRWRKLEPDERLIAEQLLYDVAAVINTTVDPSGVDPDILSIVSCDAVRRAMSANGDSFVLGSTADAEAWTPIEAVGQATSRGIFLTRENKKLLGAFSGKAFAIRPDFHL